MMVLLKLQESESEPLESPASSRTTYTTHPPIAIDGNSGFTNASGVIWGMGTAQDPYIIANWEISTSGDTTAIDIQNTNAHFIVRDCSLIGGEDDTSVYFENVANGTISDCALSGSDYGISFSDSYNCTIENNTLFGFAYGIGLSLSENCVIMNNSLKKTLDYQGIGIHLRDSEGITVLKNIIENSQMGIRPDCCESCFFFDNKMKKCGFFLLSDETCCLTTHSISINNTVNGKPVYFYKNGSFADRSVPAGAGQVLIVNASDLKVIGQDLSEVTCGLFVGDSKDISVESNSFSTDYYGILFVRTDGNCTISDNTFTGNGHPLSSWMGMAIYYSNNTKIENNTCIDFFYAYIIESSSNITITNNNLVGNLIAALVLIGSNNTLTNNNICSHTSYLSSPSYGHGMYILDSRDNILIDNDCSNNSVGVFLDGSDHNSLINNTCSGNTDVGILLDSSSNNTLSNNSCTDGPFGIKLDFSNDNEIWNNLLFSNHQHGLSISAGNDNSIWNNTFIFNSGSGTLFDPAFVQANDDGFNNCWNTSGMNSDYGNYWADLTTPDNVPPWGIVDWSYNISGLSGAKDYYPLTNWTRDNLPPNTSAVLSGIAEKSGWYTSSVQITLIASDSNGSGVKVTLYRLDNGSWNNYYEPINVETNGDHWIEYYSVDNAWNKEVTKSNSFKLDRTVPMTFSTESGTHGENGWFVSSVSIGLQVPLDLPSGINCTKYRINGGTWIDYTTDFTITSEGAYEVQYFSEDNAGNIESAKSLSIKIDLTNPTLEIDQNDSCIFKTTSVNISWSASDNVSGIDHYEFSVDDGTWLSTIDNSTTSILLKGLENGDHILKLRAVDKSGNSAEQNLTFMVSIATDDDDGDEDTPADTSSYWLTVGAAIAVVAAVLTIAAFAMRKRGQKPLE